MSRSPNLPSSSADVERRALSSVPVLDADGWSRRRFLQAIGLGVAGGAVLGAGGELFAGSEAASATSHLAGLPLGAGDGVLVLVTLYGGNDGLNTLVPYTNGHYYDQRQGLAIPAEQTLPLDGTYALHPNLPTLKSYWDAGRLAAVHGVGYSPPDLSHFSSMAIWMSGRYGPINLSTGWLGRWLDSLPPEQATLAVAEVGVSIPLHLANAVGGRGPVAVPLEPVLIGMNTPARVRQALLGMQASGTERGPWGDAVSAAMANTIAVANQVGGAYPPAQLTGFVGRMTMAARLINADVGLRVLSISLDGFDTHAAQPDMHPWLLSQLDAGVAAFFAALRSDRRRQVTIATVSEFGRTPHANYSAGTDHGTANVHFVLGDNVRGGHYGEAPRLATLDTNRRLVSTLDFRTLYANLVQDWLRGDGAGTVGGGFAPLGLFAAPPGASPPPPAAHPVPAAGFVPMTPLRLFDTRDGTGGREGQLAGGEEWRFQMSGRHGVPGEAQAVVLNLTSTETTDGTFVTAWNTGTALPLASNLNPRPGRSIPNLVVGRVGHRGEVSFYNAVGGVDLVGDLVGYFDPAIASGLMPLVPHRLLDTRDTNAPLGEEQSLDLTVVGVGGVPLDATAVALNITVTQGTNPSFLTTWPTGEPMPLAGSLNWSPGLSVANMVIARVGSGGRISAFNRYGWVHVVVDVLACFRGGQPGGRFVPLTPERLVDTREGVGAPRSRVGTSTDLPVQVAGVGGVPANATAALINVTAVLPSQPTYVTVYPYGVARPLAASLNAVPGDVVPNMVIAALGDGGRTTLFNRHGDVDLVADVMGYFVQ